MLSPVLGNGLASVARHSRSVVRSRPLPDAAGQAIGSRARKLYPNGSLVSEWESGSAAKLTQQLIAGGVSEIFEAMFLGSPHVARADILQRQNGECVREVKPRFSDTDPIDDLIDGLACTVLVTYSGSRQSAPGS